MISTALNYTKQKIPKIDKNTPELILGCFIYY